MDTGERPAPTVAEVGEYCRRVESHLTRANGGHLVRVVGPGFELVRSWALAGVPLSVVCRAIDDKAARHRERRSAHPLRIEFCEADVREAFDRWRRAVGVTRADDGAMRDDRAGETGDEEPAAPAAGRSLSRHLERVVERLARVAGRTELPDAIRDVANVRLPELIALREQARRARGPRKDEVIAALPAIDRALMAGARAAAPPDLLAALAAEADRELAPYRSRIAPADWQRARDVTVDRLLRERFGLPACEFA